MARHTLSVLVQDQPGVLARVASLFSRRGYNIESLAVGPTESAGISRMTIVVDVSAENLEQVTKQLNKLINVLKIIELDDSGAVERELMLIKVKGTNRTEVLQLVSVFRAHIIDVTADHVTVEATGSRDKLSALVEVLAPYGIKEIVQSGIVALSRGAKGIGDRTARSPER
jgi:acetolactate synthase-1/3 small subunit